MFCCFWQLLRVVDSAVEHVGDDPVFHAIEWVIPKLFMTSTCSGVLYGLNDIHAEQVGMCNIGSFKEGVPIVP